LAEPPAEPVVVTLLLVVGCGQGTREPGRAWQIVVGVCRCHSASYGGSPSTTSGAVPVEFSLISAVRTHALCVHMQHRLGRRRRRASRRNTAAHRPYPAAHTLHTHGYAGLIRPREKAPRNSDLQHEPQREPAGHSIVHTQKRAKNQRKWWRGFCRSASRPDLRRCEGAGRRAVPMQPPWRCTTQCRRSSSRVPRNRSIPRGPLDLRVRDPTVEMRGEHGAQPSSRSSECHSSTRCGSRRPRPMC
jgi:hypothetical protein